MTTSPEVAKVRRLTFFERAVIVAIIVGAIVYGVVAGIALVRQNDVIESNRQISVSQDQAVCIARLTADFQAAVGDALAAPPAPNAARLDATERIARTSYKLHHVDRYCPVSQ